MHLVKAMSKKQIIVYNIEVARKSFIPYPHALITITYRDPPESLRKPNNVAGLSVSFVQSNSIEHHKHIDKATADTIANFVIDVLPDVELFIVADDTDGVRAASVAKAISDILKLSHIYTFFWKPTDVKITGMVSNKLMEACNARYTSQHTQGKV